MKPFQRMRDLAVPVIKNRMFQPLGVLLSDGTMLHMPPRAQREVAAPELDAPHLRATLASGQVALLARVDQADGARQPPAPRPEPASPGPPEPETAAAATPRSRKARKG